MTAYTPKTDSTILNQVVRCERRKLDDGTDGVVAKNLQGEMLIAEGETEEEAISKLIAMTLYEGQCDHEYDEM